MNPTLARHVLYALIVCSVAFGSVHAAQGGASGGESGESPAGPSDAVHHRRDAALAARNVKADARKPDEPTRRSDATTQNLNARNSAAPNRQRAAALRATGLLPQRGVATLLPPAHAILSRPAVAAARANRLRGLDADHAANRRDPLTQAARGLSVMTAPAGGAGHQYPAALAAAGRAPASLKALAGNGVIGGARAAGLGSVGGPANGKIVIKASGIDGSALHRRS